MARARSLLAPLPASATARGVLLSLSLTMVACTVEYASSLGEQCELASDCAAPLVCRLGYCRTACNASRDCALGVSCVADEELSGSCLLPEETRCGLDSECPSPLVCRMGLCVNECTADRDCVDGAACMVVAEQSVCVDVGEGRCVADPDCTPPFVCGPFGACVAECLDNRDCPGGVCRAQACFFPEGPCDADTDCDDGLFCNGRERCAPLRANADRRGCAPSEEPVCDTDEVCDEAQDACESRCDAGADLDGDGQDAVDCGGTDCDDDDARAFMGADERCNGRDEDCDAMVDEDFDTASDVDHCGGCGNVCPREGATPSCAEGVCGFSCAAGFADCDGDADNACEVDLMSDSLSCGGCGDVCPLAQGCADGACVASPLVEVATGATHTCARRGTGGVLCWGRNADMQLGNGGTDASPVPVAVTGLVDATSIALGEAHGCALVSDGSVWCWGSNDEGQLGDGTRTDRGTPVRVRGPRDAIELALGRAHSCVRTRAGVISCWGSNAAGQLGDGLAAADAPEAVPVAGFSPNIAELFAGDTQTCAAHTSRDAQCVGGGLTSLRGTAGLGGIAVSGGDACGIDVSGFARCWNRGSLPTSPAGLEATAIDALDVGGRAGSEFRCVAGAGHVYCWGESPEGRLGRGVGLGHEAGSPGEVVGVSDAVDVATGDEHACAARADGSVSCWGNNDHGQLGNGVAAVGDDAPTPVAVEALP